MIDFVLAAMNWTQGTFEKAAAEHSSFKLYSSSNFRHSLLNDLIFIARCR